MRLTVGPLPPAVYWRRRALVLGAVLAVVLLITYSCTAGNGGGDVGGTTGQGGNGAAPAGSGPAASGAAAGGATPEPSYSMLSPSPEPSGVAVAPGGGGGPGGNAPVNVDAGQGTASPCADSELSVVPSAEAPSVQQGVPIKLFMRIKNISARTCVRDVGATMQELYLQQGTTKHWSSDACDRRTGTDVVTFPPNHEVSYWLTWDGKATLQGCENRPWLARGTYQLFGRLGTNTSEPVPFTVTA